MIGISETKFRENPDIVRTEAKNINLKLHTDRLLQIIIKKPPLYRPIKLVKYKRHIKYIRSQRPDVLYAYVHNLLAFFLLKLSRRMVEQEISLNGIPKNMESMQSKTKRILISELMSEYSTRKITMN